MTAALVAMAPTSDSADNLAIGNWYLVYSKARQESVAARGLGVQKLIRFGVLYLPVVEGVITALKTREGPKSGCRRLGAPALQPGARVRINTGPFAGLEGIFEARAGQDRVVILLELLGQRARMWLAAEEVGA